MKSEKLATQADALANVRDYFPDLTENQKAALAAWSSFQAIVEAPFLPNTDAARKGTFFSILKLGEGRFQDVDDPSEHVEKWLVFVRLAHDADLELRNGEKVHFAKNSLAKIALPKGEGLRDQVASSLAQILAAHGEIPIMQLRELPASQIGRNGAIVLHTPIEAIL